MQNLKLSVKIYLKAKKIEISDLKLIKYLLSKLPKTLSLVILTEHDRKFTFFDEIYYFLFYNKQWKLSLHVHISHLISCALESRSHAPALK